MNKKMIICKFNNFRFKVNCFVLPKSLYGVGLMFKQSFRAKPLLFTFNNSREKIHSFFVSFPFYAIWMDDKFNIIEVKKVKPWTFSVGCRRRFSYLLEVPIVSNRNFLPSGFRRAFGNI